MTRFLPSILILVLPAAAMAQNADSCRREFEIEKARIERALAQSRPAQNDPDSQARWVKPHYEALERAGRKADACERRNRPPLPASAQDCMSRVRAESEALQARDRGKTLSAAEQKARRDADMKLHDAMMRCSTGRR